MESEELQMRQTCYAVWNARRPVKVFFTVLGTGWTIGIAAAIFGGHPALAAGVVAGGVFFLVGYYRKIIEKVSPLTVFNIRRSSWGFLAMGTLLAGAAYCEAELWYIARTNLAGGWPNWRWYDQWYAWLIYAAAVLVYTTRFRRGEAKNYDDYFRFDSIGKLIHDYMAVPFTFAVVVMIFPTCVVTSWPNTQQRILVCVAMLLIIFWGLAGGMDLQRTKATGPWRLYRPNLHVQADKTGRAYNPPLEGAPSAVAFRDHRRRPANGKHTRQKG